MKVTTVQDEQVERWKRAQRSEAAVKANFTRRVKELEGLPLEERHDAVHDLWEQAQKREEEARHQHSAAQMSTCLYMDLYFDLDRQLNPEDWKDETA